MNPHEPKYCPRCHAAFECRVNDIRECQCSAIIFTAAEKASIEGKYSDCLCRNCLLELKQELQVKATAE